MKDRKKTVQECQTLAEYRLEILRVPQHAIARLSNHKQGYISRVEAGNLPRMWNRAVIAKAYQLVEAEFVRLIVGAKKAKSMSQPATASFPLAQFQKSEGAVVIGLDETARHAAQGNKQSQAILNAKVS